MTEATHSKVVDVPAHQGRPQGPSPLSVFETRGFRKIKQKGAVLHLMKPGDYPAWRLVEMTDISWLGWTELFDPQDKSVCRMKWEDGDRKHLSYLIFPEGDEQRYTLPAQPVQAPPGAEAN